ncbi:MAG: hypothetical protein FWD66_06420 [Paludibacter sp.]|nr:hypothetical protein [Paludibacter sp.]
MTIEKVRNYVNGGNYANMFIVSYDKRKVFGEKGGHRAFCLIHFASKTGGKGQSFAISKKTYLSLKNNGCKIATVIK